MSRRPVTAANAGEWRSVPGLSEVTLRVLASEGYESMTPVQAAAIPQFLSHKDVAAEAVTGEAKSAAASFARGGFWANTDTSGCMIRVGSGKTLAYVVPIVELLLRNPPRSTHTVGGVVLSPTRELAEQIKGVLEPFAVATQLSTLLLTGGEEPQQDVIRYREVEPVRQLPPHI